MVPKYGSQTTAVGEFNGNGSGDGSSYIGGNHTEPSIAERFPEPSGTIGNHTFRLTIQALPLKGWPSVNNRFRGLLKVMLRSYGFRVVEIKPD
jgi:hypothetical protein